MNFYYRLLSIRSGKIATFTITITLGKKWTFGHPYFLVMHSESGHFIDAKSSRIFNTIYIYKYNLLFPIYSNLLRSQLIPVEIHSHSDVAVVTSLATKDGIQAAPSDSRDLSGGSFESSLTAFSALSKAHSISANIRNEERSNDNSRIRKRTTSDEEHVGMTPKQACIESQGSMVKRPNCRPAQDRFGFEAIQFLTRFPTQFV